MIPVNFPIDCRLTLEKVEAVSKAINENDYEFVLENPIFGVIASKQFPPQLFDFRTNIGYFLLLH